MLFSGIPFLFYFLPAVLILYFLVPNRMRNIVLLLSSLLFYAWGEPKFVVLMAFSILIYYAFGLFIAHSERRRRKLWLILSIITGAVLLGIFKYYNFFLNTFNNIFGTSLPLLKLALPIGISFYTFQCISYTVDVYRNDAEAQTDFIAFGTFVSMFPQLIAGPIVRYVDVENDLTSRSHSFQNFTAGVPRFLIGLGKKVLLANNLALLVRTFRQSPAPSVLFYWMYAIAFTLHIYFDFSGYSDMAIGLGRIFGFHFPENFNYPYISRSITEFWRRWHMTLSRWFRDYVYIPLGGNRVGTLQWIRNIFIVWMLTGLWHGAAWNFVLWGLLFAVMLVLEKWVPALKELPRVAGHVYVMFIVILSFVLFNAESLSQAVADLGSLFGITGLPLSNKVTIYYLRSYGFLLLVAAAGATPYLRNLCLRLQRSFLGKFLEILRPAALAILLVVCTAYLVDGSYNPFLYFRF